MKYYDLDTEELEILNNLETFSSVKNASTQKKELQKISQNQLKKTKVISLRLSEKDIFDLKSEAAEEGIPYQTLAGSVIHKFLKSRRRMAA